MTTAQRATTVDEIDKLFECQFPDESFEHGQAFKPQPTDIIITPYAKSGTTWLQQIVHGLRTRGDMDFEEISDVVPWFDTAQMLGIDLENPHPAKPRAYKSHLEWGRIPKGGKYIVSLRNPYGMLRSLYYFFEGWYFEPGSISMLELAHKRFVDHLPDRGYAAHLVSWWEQRSNPNVLLLCFEEMKQDLPGTIRTVADFIGIELDDELFEIIQRQSSLDFMVAHVNQFDDHKLRLYSEEVCGLPSGSDSAKVRGDKRAELSDEVKALINEAWKREIEPAIGFASYDDLRIALVDLNR